MRKTMIFAAIAALAFASTADAKSCKDAKGHFMKCPVAAAPAAPATGMASGKRQQKLITVTKETDAASPMLATRRAGGTPMAAASTGGTPHCTKGKPCGKSCIAMDKVCHK